MSTSKHSVRLQDVDYDEEEAEEEDEKEEAGLYINMNLRCTLAFLNNISLFKLNKVCKHQDQKSRKLQDWRSCRPSNHFSSIFLPFAVHLRLKHKKKTKKTIKIVIRVWKLS